VFIKEMMMMMMTTMMINIGRTPDVPYTWSGDASFKQEAQLSPTDRAMRRVN